MHFTWSASLFVHFSPKKIIYVSTCTCGSILWIKKTPHFVHKFSRGAVNAANCSPPDRTRHGKYSHWTVSMNLLVLHETDKENHDRTPCNAEVALLPTIVLLKLDDAWEFTAGEKGKSYHIVRLHVQIISTMHLFSSRCNEKSFIASPPQKRGEEQFEETHLIHNPLVL